MERVKRLEAYRISKSGYPENIPAFPDMKVAGSSDAFGEQNKIAIRWILQATHERDFADFPATHKKFEAQGVESCILRRTKSRRHGLYATCLYCPDD